MQLTNVLVLSGAAGVMALPGHEAHRHAHDKRIQYVKVTHTVTEFITEVVGLVSSAPPVMSTPSSNFSLSTASTTRFASSSATPKFAPVIAFEKKSTSPSSSSTTSSTTSVAPSIISSVVAAKATVGSSTGASSGSRVGTFDCSSSSKRATYAEESSGNVGEPWGCNIKKISSSDISAYDYTVIFNNIASNTFWLQCWNTRGRDGLLNGFWPEKGNAFTTTIEMGASQAVAFMEDFNGACAYGPGSAVATTSIGQVAGMWVEFNFGMLNSGGTRMSGVDCSAKSSTEGSSLSFAGCKVYKTTGEAVHEDASKAISQILSDGTGILNAYIGTQNADGLSVNFLPGTVGLTVDMGFSG